MTTEEAIKAIQIHLAYLPMYSMPKTREALEMAIAALREQEALTRNLHGVASNEQVTEPLRHNGSSDSEQSFATKNQVTSDWIRVDEQLPEEAIRVLVRLSGINPPIGFPRMDTDRIIDGRWVRWGDLVTHWIPLPESQEEA